MAPHAAGADGLGNEISGMFGGKAIGGQRRNVESVAKGSEPGRPVFGRGLAIAGENLRRLLEPSDDGGPWVSLPKRADRDGRHEGQKPAADRPMGGPERAAEGPG